MLRSRGRHVARMGASFNALWLGQTVSLLGDYIAYYTVPRYVLELTDRASAFTTIFAFENAPTLLFGFFGGVIIDRFSRKTIAMYADVWRAAAFVLLAYLAAAGTLTVWTLAAISFLIGSLAAAFNAALMSFVPMIVRRDRLTTANSRLAISQQIAFVVGPFLGALLVQTTQSFPLTFMINGFTFVISAVSLLIARPLIRQARITDSSFRDQILQGLEFLWKDRILRFTTLALFSVNLVVGFVEPTLVLVANKLLGLETDSDIRWVFLAFSIGGLIGALTATRVVRRIDLGRTFVAGVAMFAVGLGGLASRGPLLIVLASITVGFIGLPWLNVAAVTIRQLRSPDEMLGRITAASRAVSWGSLPIGAVIGGFLADDVLSLDVVLLSGPLWLGLTAFLLLFTPVWRMKKKTEEAVGSGVS